ncbi:MAG TPA: ABC transporter permease [Sporichthyaceae bacterium]|nr:ABC transporter permease [Sporichthyaceae bacterium]
MRDYVPYIIFGFVTGSVYGICAMGLVLTYKTSGVFNFGHGAVCAASAYAFYDLRQVHGLPWPVAGLLVVFVMGPLVGLILERIAAGLAPVSTAYKIVGTVGILVFIQAAIVLHFTGQGLRFAQFLPEDKAFAISGVTVTDASLITTLIGIGAAVALFLFFRLTRLGTAIRGVVDDPQLLDMTGESPNRVRRTAWVIGSVFASVSGILFAASQEQVDVNVLSILIVQAFGAATVALFRNLPMCLIGGWGVALAQKLISKALGGGHEQLAGLDLTIPFLVVFLGLLVIPRRYLVEIGRAVKPRAAKAGRLTLGQRRIGVGAVFVLAMLVPTFADTHQIAWDVALTQVALFMSLHLLVRTSGQISLCQIGFAAIGASTFAHMLHHGVPFLVAVLIGGLVCLPVALIISVPAIRLSGLYLGLATLGFGILLNQFFYSKSYMFGFGSVETGRPGYWGLDDDKRYYYLLLAFAVLAVGLVLIIERSRLGRLLRGMADAPVALSTLGLAVNVSRVLVFCVAGFMAGISGALYASMFGAVKSDSYFFLQSLIVLAVLAISGRRTVAAAVIAPLLLFVVPNYITDPDFFQILQMFFGVAAILAAIGSQGAFERWFATTAARFTERRTGPASVRLEDFHQRHRAGRVPVATP